MTEDHDEVIRNFYRVRQILGILGFCLPILLIIGGLLALGQVEASISDYYHTLLRDLYVGIMFAIAIFLICYTGHRRGVRDRLSDDVITTIAGVAALGVAIFPNEGHGMTSVTQALLGKETAVILHYCSAVVFLGCVGSVSFFRFARTAQPHRRRIYRLCGAIIWGVTVLVVVTSYCKVRGPEMPMRLITDWMLVFWLETIGIWAFSIAWLVKGRIDLGLLRVLSSGPHSQEPPNDETTRPST